MFAKKLTVLSAAAALALGTAGLISGCANNDTGQPMSNDTGMYNNRANTAGSSVNPDDSYRNYGNNRSCPHELDSLVSMVKSAVATVY